MNTLLSFTDTPVTKTQLIKEIEAHAKADRFLQGMYGELETEMPEFKGCAVGCTLRSFNAEPSNHKEYERLFGIPESLARLEDRIFEGLSVEESKAWPLRFSEAIPEGKDLSKVIIAFKIRLLEECLTYDRAKYPQVDKAVHQVIEALKGNGSLIEARNSAWEARRAADAVADAVAYAAADAADAAADDDDDVAYAAYAYAVADADAVAVADAVAYAVRESRWLKISQILVECLESAQ